ncbi:hypothetical protein ASF91_22285 [Rhizobium sp. Leaf155]|nr:hypothetical protein ASF91_22285 [Rhizobium sp. Leaf155]
MLSRFNDIDALVSPHDVQKPLYIGDYSIRLYTGKSAETLESKGFLNFIVYDPEGEAFTVSLASLRQVRLRVENQCALLEPNTSSVVGIWVEGEKLCAQQWDGYLSRFDITTGDLLSQEFTK